MGDIRVKKKRQRKSKFPLFFVGFVVLLGIAAGAAYHFELYTYLPLFSGFSKEYALYDDVGNALGGLLSQTQAEIKSWPAVYVVERDRDVAPLPKAENYDENFTSYSDETITVKYYTEKYSYSHIHYLDVRIAHPSQIRLGLCGNEFDMKKRDYPSEIAKSVNAVAAIDGCFYNNRSSGWMIYQGNVLRTTCCWYDVLLIDADGNLHAQRDLTIDESGILEQYDIVNALTFGPQLVKDGKAKYITVGTWQPYTPEPRAAICQFPDGLHYLLCVAEGRMGRSRGLTMQQFANLLASKGVDFAYNLDGGQSGTLILGNHVKNVVAYGGQRRLGDILYFATAMENDEASEAQ